MSLGVCSMQSTGQKLTQASYPVQLSGITTAISFGLFFLRVGTETSGQLKIYCHVLNRGGGGVRSPADNI